MKELIETLGEPTRSETLRAMRGPLVAEGNRIAAAMAGCPDSFLIVARSKTGKVDVAVENAGGIGLVSSDSVSPCSVSKGAGARAELITGESYRLIIGTSLFSEAVAEYQNKRRVSDAVKWESVSILNYLEERLKAVSENILAVNQLIG